MKKMNKKGFTLVELMGVIAVMAVLIVVVATNGFGVFNKAKSSQGGSAGRR